MAEKRLFHATIQNPDNNETDYEAFYEAHTVSSVRDDAGKRHIERGAKQAFAVKHENLTKQPKEFYDRLKQAEGRAKVITEKVKGVGQRWEVQPQEVEDSSSPFVGAPDSDGSVPPAVQPTAEWYTPREATDEEVERFLRLGDNGLHQDELKDFDEQMQEDYGQEHIEPTEEELNAHYKLMESRLSEPPNQKDEDRVGIPDDDDDYEEEPDPQSTAGDTIVRESSLARPDGSFIRAKPQFYNIAGIAMDKDPLGEMARQELEYATGTPEQRQKYEAIAGFNVPKGSEKDPYDTDELPSQQQQKEEYDKLISDPATYERKQEDEEVNPKIPTGPPTNPRPMPRRSCLSH